jgi:glycerol-3-phosphate dehydrogenase
MLPGTGTKDFKAFAAKLKESYQEIPERLLARLWRIYGTRAASVLKLCEEDTALMQSFDNETGALCAEVVLAFRDEMAESLSDCLLRRTMVGLNSSAGLNAVEAAAQVAHEHLGWTEERAAREVADYRAYVERFHPAGLVTESAETHS